MSAPDREALAAAVAEARRCCANARALMARDSLAAPAVEAAIRQLDELLVDLEAVER